MEAVGVTLRGDLAYFHHGGGGAQLCEVVDEVVQRLRVTVCERKKRRNGYYKGWVDEIT